MTSITPADSPAAIAELRARQALAHELMDVEGRLNRDIKTLGEFVSTQYDKNHCMLLGPAGRPGVAATDEGPIWVTWKKGVPQARPLKTTDLTGAHTSEILNAAVKVLSQRLSAGQWEQVEVVKLDLGFGERSVARLSNFVETNRARARRGVDSAKDFTKSPKVRRVSGAGAALVTVVAVPTALMLAGADGPGDQHYSRPMAQSKTQHAQMQITGLRMDSIHLKETGDVLPWAGAELRTEVNGQPLKLHADEFDTADGLRTYKAANDSTLEVISPVIESSSGMVHIRITDNDAQERDTVFDVNAQLSNDPARFVRGEDTQVVDTPNGKATFTVWAEEGPKKTQPSVDQVQGLLNQVPSPAEFSEKGRTIGAKTTFQETYDLLAHARSSLMALSPDDSGYEDALAAYRQKLASVSHNAAQDRQEEDLVSWSSFPEFDLKVLEIS